MATSTVPVSIEKRRLRNTSMYINRIQSSKAKTLIRTLWKIEHFIGLENGIYYKSDVPQLACCLSIYKNKRTVYIKVVPEEYNKTIDCIMYSDGFIKIKETGRYEFQIPFEIIQDEWLCFYFYFQKRDETTPAIRPLQWMTDGPFINDVEACKLFDDINLQISCNTEFNFSLLLNRGCCHTRKEFLAARCKFFYNYFKENPDTMEYRLDTREEIVNYFLIYLMRGTMFEPTKLEDLIDLFLLAVFLEIPGLQSRCEVALKEYMNRDHVLQIREAGVKSGTESLVSAADNFLGETRT